MIYKDPKRTPEERAEDLLPRMTLSEKVAQMVQIPRPEVTEDELLMWAERGAGSFLHILGDNARRLQKIALSSRLGIPIIFGIDAIHGHGIHYGATIFPSQLALACSWNPGLAYEMGRVTAREVAADGLHWTFSPVLCLGRDTRWGRVDETFGEDPYLAGELGAALVKGYQGENLSDGDSILACAKHYIGYGEATGGRDAVDTEMTFRKMREVMLPPFKKAVEAGCATVMTAYGSIDGTPFTASEKAMKTILKEELGFDGFVVTDWDNIGNLLNRQHVAENMEEASRMGVVAGNDMLMNTPGVYDALINLVESGRMDVKHIDEAVRRILRVKFLAGLFENPEKSGDADIFGCEAHLKANRRAAGESFVLLENRNGILPLAPTVKSIAVIGPNSDSALAMYGDWTYFTHPYPNKDAEPAKPYYTVLGGIQEVAKPLGVEVTYHQGCHVSDANGQDIRGAVNAAKGSDAIVLAVGDIVGQFGEFNDRADLSLSGAQQELFDRLRELGKPVITVLLASKPLTIPKIAEESDALFALFHGGQYGGLALAEAIFGKLNPSGKLPISFPRHSGQLPVYYNYLPGWHGDVYRDLEAGPLYEFGYGLSYTHFEYSDLKAECQAQGAEVSVTVKNSGGADGTETVQLYMRDKVSSVITPVKQLIAFERVSLKAGESQTVIFRLDKSAFSIVLPDETRVVEPGTFILMAGGDSRDGSLLKTEIVLYS
jgi:beta-glucosidase